MYSVETEIGTISITKNVIGKIITDAVDAFHGKVIISNHRGKIPRLVSKLGGMDETSNMEINFGEDGIDVRVFIVIRFGTSITMVTNQLVDEIHETISIMTGREPNSVAVVVSGIISKNVAKRHIEVTTNDHI